MADFTRNVDWVAELIPDVSERTEPFTVDTEEVDDELVEIFVEEIGRLSGELQEGLERQNGETVRMAAHSIKGMGGTMGLPEISVLGLEIETLARTGRLADAEPMIRALAEWITAFGRD